MMKWTIPFFILFLAFSTFSQTATVISTMANLRGTPSEKGKIVVKVQKDESVEIIKQSGAWFLVQTTDYVGWLHGNTIRLDEENITQSVSQPLPPNRTTKTPRNLVLTPSRNTPSKQYIRGPRGGCFYYNSNGNKTYVDRGLCG